MKDISLVSYTAADTLPIKMLVHPNTRSGMKTGVLIPIHIQLAITNRCNLLCPFCSYGNVDRDLELGMTQVVRLLDDFSSLGTRAVTVTGGGEPTLHPFFDAILDEIVQREMEAGLITNGTMLDKVSSEGLNWLTWCRVSCSDYWDYDKYANKVAGVRNKVNSPDWGMSYVVAPDGNFNPKNFVRCVQLAHNLAFKYVRVVGDLTHPDAALSKDDLQKLLGRNFVDSSRVIYQGRKNTTTGFNPCWISLVKPYIGADGGVYPCCGVQYAQEEVSFNTPMEMRMGMIEDVKRIWKNQSVFNGEKCVRCHYHQYNTVWGMLKQGVDHAEFV